MRKLLNTKRKPGRYRRMSSANAGDPAKGTDSYRRPRAWYPMECVHGYDCCPKCDGARRDPQTLRPVTNR